MLAFVFKQKKKKMYTIYENAMHAGYISEPIQMKGWVTVSLGSRLTGVD